MTADDWKTFEIRRGMICHEDAQINQRVGFQLTTQSFLLTASAVLLGSEALPAALRGFLLFLISSVAVILGWFFHIAVRAARTEQSRLRGDEDCERGGPSYDEVLRLTGNEAEQAQLKKCLQAHGRTLGGGFSYVPWVQGLMTLLWIPFWFIGMLEIIGVAVLARRTVAPSGTPPPESTADFSWHYHAMLATTLVTAVAAVIAAYWATRVNWRTADDPRSQGAPSSAAGWSVRGLPLRARRVIFISLLAMLFALGLIFLLAVWGHLPEDYAWRATVTLAILALAIIAPVNLYKILLGKPATQNLPQAESQPNPPP